MATRLDVRKTHKLLIGGKFVRSESGRTSRAAVGTIGDLNVPRASRKDLRDAVRAARTAVGAWSGATAMNRGQVLYRVAEMLDARRTEFGALLGGGRRALAEVDAAVNTWVWYAGWTDKLSQVAGSVNPVAGPYFTFTLPEPTGVVGIVAPLESGLSGLARHLAPALCAGNTAVVIASERHPVVALSFAEVLLTSDLPAGTVNLLTGQRRELLPWLAGHRDVNAIDAGACTAEERTLIEERAADSVKRVVGDPRGALDPAAITALMEFKTVWHPIGA